MATPSETPQKPRILALSDLIFGLALSISALSLIGQQPSTTQQLFTALGIYALGFFILIAIWRLYSTTTSVLRSETSALIGLNIVLLFFVSIEPYLFAELFSGSGNFPSTVSQVYAFDIGFMFLILAIFNQAISSEKKNLEPESSLAGYRRIRNMCLLDAAIFFVSTVPFFDSVTFFSFTKGALLNHFTLRTTLWVIGLIGSWTSRLLGRETKPGRTSKIAVKHSEEDSGATAGV